MIESNFPPTFLSKAVALLADTNSGLSGPQIVNAINLYGDRWRIAVPHPAYPFDAPNKRQALLDSLRPFTATQQFQILEELCDHHGFAVGSPSRAPRQQLKAELFARFGHLRANKEVKELDVALVEEARHWLHTHSAALAKFDEAKLKYDGGVFQRNLIDDLRLALELLLRSVLSNGKSLENQLPLLGAMLKGGGATPQFANMFQKLLEYYAQYQNQHVKHDDTMPADEVEFIFEVTASFMKRIARLGPA